MEEAIRYYYEKNYKYRTILEFLEKFHGIKMCMRTLKSKLNEFGLGKRNYNASRDQVRECIQRELDGCGQLLGYRAMWRLLQRKYEMRVPRKFVESILQELDPEGSRLRRAHRLQRRVYLNPGPNHCWHADGYDKLKPFGFPIHGCIDGFSRRIMWLEITKSNNNPNVIANLFLNCVKEQQSCPTIIRTDRGTENCVMATAQSFLRRTHHDVISGLKAHQYGSSHSNQRIEAWWALLRRSWASWWINFFKDLVANGILDTSKKLHVECLWFSFINVMKQSLNDIKESWNSHYVRRSRYHTAHGIPNQLFFLPESVHASDCKKIYLHRDILEIEHHINLPNDDESRTYQEYFAYNSAILGLGDPQNWRESLTVFRRLVAEAE